MRRRRSAGQRPAAGCVLCLLAIACNDPVAPDPRPGWLLKPAILLHHGIPTLMHVPDSVPPGAQFSIAFVTFGPGCDEVGETLNTVNGNEIEIHPLDWTPVRPTAMCPDSIVRIFPHSVEVQVNQSGPARVRVHGRREPGGTDVIFAATIQIR